MTTAPVPGWRGRYEALGGRLLVLTAWVLPTAAVALPHGASTSFTVVFLYALGTLVHLPARWRGLTRAERWLILAMLALFLAPLASLVNADDLHEFGKRYERHLRFLGFIPVFLLARAAGRDLLRALVWGCAAAGLVALGVAVYDLAWLDKERAEGAYHPIVFGDLTAAYGLLLVAWAATGARGPWSRLGWLAAAGAAFGATVLSGTRGAWLGVVVVLALLPLILPRTRAGRIRAVAAGVVAALLGGWLALQLPPVAAKVEETVWWVGVYLAGFEAPSSSQARFELWRLAWDLWRAHPWVGEGFGDFPAYVRAACRGELDYGVAWPLAHAHNVYLQFLATTGVTGLAALVAAVVLTPWVLARAAFRRGARPPGLALSAFTVAFAVFGLTEDWTARSPFTAGYSLLLALLAAAAGGASDSRRGPCR